MQRCWKSHSTVWRWPSSRMRYMLYCLWATCLITCPTALCCGRACRKEISSQNSSVQARTSRILYPFFLVACRYFADLTTWWPLLSFDWFTMSSWEIHTSFILKNVFFLSCFSFKDSHQETNGEMVTGGRSGCQRFLWDHCWTSAGWLDQKYHALRCLCGVSIWPFWTCTQISK